MEEDTHGKGEDEPARGVCHNTKSPFVGDDYVFDFEANKAGPPACGGGGALPGQLATLMDTFSLD